MILKKQWLKKILYSATVLFCGFIVGLLLLILANSLPEKNMINRYKQNYTFFGGKDGWHQLVKGYDITTIDYNTEIHMIKGALTPLPPSEENILQQSMRGYAYNESGTVHGLKEYHYTKGDVDISCDSYERYWHGYEILLTPLLLCFDYSDLIIINIFFQIILSYLVFKECKEKKLQISFIALWIFTMQPVIMMCLDYSICFYIYMIAVLLILKKSYVRKHYDMFFLIIGILTVYFDFLTWPVITLGVPLVVLLQMEKDNSYRKLLISSIMWGIGYCGMWLSKWIGGTLILSDNILKDAVSNLKYRSSSNLDGISFSLLDVLQKNIDVIINPAYLIFFAFGILIIVFGLIKRQAFFISIHNMLPILGTALYPILWICITKNHAYEHYWMTWRSLGVSVFAVISCIETNMKKKEEMWIHYNGSD